MFHRLSKHLEFRQKHSTLFSVFPDETLSLVFDILHALQIWSACKLLACLQAVTGGFIAENPPFANRAPSWIFEARAPGYERVSAKIEGGGGGGKRKTAGFSPLSPPPSRRSLCQLSTRPRPGRANSRWRPHHEFRFFDPPSNRLRAG